ncbi:MAG: YtxH domain-containing protein [Nitrospiraceae bacterium]|nr:MAG: YtxH domain-containing protein [Nitrospiraceae bacterium]
MDDYTEEKRIAGAFIIGGLIGAGISLLYAPQSGKRTRRDISRFARHVSHEAIDTIEDAADALQDMVDAVSDRMSDITISKKEITEGAKKKIVRTLENVEKAVQKQKERFL